jgi:hypothetical protein
MLTVFLKCYQEFQWLIRILDFTKITRAKWGVTSTVKALQDDAQNKLEFWVVVLVDRRLACHESFLKVLYNCKAEDSSM